MNLDELIQNQPVDGASSGTPPPTTPSATPQTQAVQQPTTPPPVAAVASTPPPTASVVASLQKAPQVNVQKTEVPQSVVPQINVNVGGREEKISIDSVSREINSSKRKSNGFLKVLVVLSMVSVGFLMLGESLDILHLQYESIYLSQAYPIIVILGALVLMKNKGIFGKLISLIIFLVVIGGLATVSTYHSLLPSSGSKFDDSFAYDANGHKNAVVHMNTYVGDYAIHFKDTTHLLEGKYKSDRALSVSTGFTNTKAPFIYFMEDTNWNVIQNLKSNLDVGFNQTANFDVYFKNFIGAYNLNLKKINRYNVKVHGGISDINLTVGDNMKENAEIELKTVWGNIEINIPKNVAVRLYYKKRPYAPGSIELTNFDAGVEEGYYESTNLGEAKTIVKISVDVGVSNFKVKRID